MNNHVAPLGKDVVAQSNISLSNYLHDVCRHIAKINFVFLAQPATRSLLEVEDAEWQDFQKKAGTAWNRMST